MLVVAGSHRSRWSAGIGTSDLRRSQASAWGGKLLHLLLIGASRTPAAAAAIAVKPDLRLPHPVYVPLMPRKLAITAVIRPSRAILQPSRLTRPVPRLSTTFLTPFLYLSVNSTQSRCTLGRFSTRCCGAGSDRRTAPTP